MTRPASAEVPSAVSLMAATRSLSAGSRSSPGTFVGCDGVADEAALEDDEDDVADGSAEGVEAGPDGCVPPPFPLPPVLPLTRVSWKEKDAPSNCVTADPPWLPDGTASMRT